MHLLGVDAIDDERWFTRERVLGMPMLTMDFVPVPEGNETVSRTQAIAASATHNSMSITAPPMEPK